uniref:Protein transport protein SEC13 n=1 Tax=Florenciella parvula TaxID=236787 RepID=A0A7S2FN42_9STRA|mmetsp:Transcript_9527/g.22537  ORF Transcript_9527/g.22537 Transcript_9527/m.22537 type:complete len:315 (-) Transcript_9527:145-1089(-)
MATPLVTFDTQHDDMIHDAQLDYYSRKLATASSDRSIKVWDVQGEVYTLAATLNGHEGPVWQCAWAHPKFGVLLASCSYDGKVLIHRESPPGVWTPIHEHTMHDSSVNSVAWAPHEYGLILGCASADGRVSVLTHQDDDTWLTEPVDDGSRLGCNAISWAPVTALSDAAASGMPPLKFVTGSCDNNVRVWERSEAGWTPTTLGEQDPPHKDWVRDVAWAPSTGISSNVIASCSEDRTVLIWTQAEPGGPWEPTRLREPFDAPVWRVSWSITGNLLAVSSGDHKVTLWKQALNGQWDQVSDVNDAGAQEGEAKQG